MHHRFIVIREISFLSHDGSMVSDLVYLSQTTWCFISWLAYNVFSSDTGKDSMITISAAEIIVRFCFCQLIGAQLEVSHIRESTAFASVWLYER